MVLDARRSPGPPRTTSTRPSSRRPVPIYGKWYFPEIPPNVALVNLETGEQESFPERMIAGEVIFVPAAELIRAGLARRFRADGRARGWPAVEPAQRAIVACRRNH